MASPRKHAIFTKMAFLNGPFFRFGLAATGHPPALSGVTTPEALRRAAYPLAPPLKTLYNYY